MSVCVCLHVDFDGNVTNFLKPSVADGNKLALGAITRRELHEQKEVTQTFKLLCIFLFLRDQDNPPPR